MAFDESTVLSCLNQAGLTVEEVQRIPERPKRLKPLPQGLASEITEALEDLYGPELYAHQVDALEAIRDGHDVCLATPTPSGKSLVFIATACDLIGKEPEARVLALYPARGLIRVHGRGVRRAA